MGLTTLPGVGQLNINTTSTALFTGTSADPTMVLGDLSFLNGQIDAGGGFPAAGIPTGGTLFASAVPEPSAFLLSMLVLCIGAFRRRLQFTSLMLAC